MTAADLTFRPATPDDRKLIESLLTANDLPATDLPGALDGFLIATVTGDVVGIGGVEAHDSTGLLRSLVVTKPARGLGIGTEVCRRLEHRARARGVDRLYLLTTTARRFFQRLGYDEIDRDRVPSVIRGTAQFVEHCPRSAACMTKALG